MIAPADRYELLDRPVDGVGPPEVKERFSYPGLAYTRLLELRDTNLNLYGGLEPIHRLMVQEATS